MLKFDIVCLIDIICLIALTLFMVISGIILIFTGNYCFAIIAFAMAGYEGMAAIRSVLEYLEYRRIIK